MAKLVLQQYTLTHREQKSVTFSNYSNSAQVIYRGVAADAPHLKIGSLLAKQVDFFYCQFQLQLLYIRIINVFHRKIILFSFHIWGLLSKANTQQSLHAEPRYLLARIVAEACNVCEHNIKFEVYFPSRQ